MIIKDKDFSTGTVLDGDKISSHHAQLVTNIQQEAYAIREFSDNGFTKDRTMRQIGHIPALDAARLQVERPGIFAHEEIMNEWLKSKEGEKYLTVKRNSF